MKDKSECIVTDRISSFPADVKENAEPANSKAASGKKHGRFPMDIKLKAISMSECGMDSISIGKELDIDSSLIRGWVRKYGRYGVDGLKPASYRKKTMIEVKETGTGPAKPDTAQRIGFVRYVDNPSLMRSMVSRLSAFGISRDRLEVWNDFKAFLGRAKAGDTIIVNSLFDISSDISTLITIIDLLINNGITVISLEDNGIAFGQDGIKPSDILRVFHNFIKLAENGISPTSKSAVPPSDTGQAKPIRNVMNTRLAEAYELWRAGRSMAYAAREAGCSYSSFRNWMNRNANKKRSATTMPPDSAQK